VPALFITNEKGAIQSNAGVVGFNEDTHYAQAHREQCEDIQAAFGLKNAIIGKPMQIDMPFICEERIVDWEIQAYPNDLGDLTDDLGQQQFHALLVVFARKLRTKRKTTGGFRVVGGAEMED
jgi:hypothetical protein